MCRRRCFRPTNNQHPLLCTHRTQETNSLRLAEGTPIREQKAQQSPSDRPSVHQHAVISSLDWLLRVRGGERGANARRLPALPSLPSPAARDGCRNPRLLCHRHLVNLLCTKVSKWWSAGLTVLRLYTVQSAACFVSLVAHRRSRHDLQLPGVFFCKHHEKRVLGTRHTFPRQTILSLKLLKVHLSVAPRRHGVNGSLLTERTTQQYSGVTKQKRNTVCFVQQTHGVDNYIDRPL